MKTRSAEQIAVVNWFYRNGGKATALSATKRIAEELKELLDAVEHGDFEHAREEAADVGICLLMASECLGFDLFAAMRWKQSINDHRQWHADEHGCLHHVKGTDPRDSSPASEGAREELLTLADSREKPQHKNGEKG